jgi:hypothetical protein
MLKFDTSKICNIDETGIMIIKDMCFKVIEGVTWSAQRFPPPPHPLSAKVGTNFADKRRSLSRSV